MDATRTLIGRQHSHLAAALVLLAGMVALLALACGGEESAGEASPDERYVRDLCLAGRALETAMVEAGSELRRGDPEEAGSEAEALTELLIEPLEELLEALRETTPPGEMAAFHNATVAALSDTLEFLKDAEGADAFELPDSLGSMDVPAPSVAVRDRLAEVANDVPECRGSSFLLGVMGGGG